MKGEGKMFIKKTHTADIKNNNNILSRRKFLSLFATLPLIGTFSIVSDPKDNIREDEFILVNGWVLKKRDLNVI